jgi:hypothetical protein
MVKRQPLRGLLPLIFLISASLLCILLSRCFHVEYANLAVWALFFVWTAFMLSLWDECPIRKIPHPLGGFLLLILSMLSGLFHFWVMKQFKLESFYWPIIANLFLGLGITVAFEFPKFFLQRLIFWYALAITLVISVGMVPAIWFAWFVYFFFWLEQWPVKQTPQPIKGFLTFLILAALSFILEASFRTFGTSFFKPEGSLWFVLFVWWLVSTSWQFETWPFKSFPQPLKGFLGLILCVLGASFFFFVIAKLKIAYPLAANITWVFVSWLYSWDICMDKWPA